MLSHDNLIFNSSSLTLDVIRGIPEDTPFIAEETRIVSYLPLSHIAGL
jgi:long-subunit acyl-CoA synthetase (AMP-forming)